MKNFIKKLTSSVMAFVTAIMGISLTPMAANVSAAENWVAGNGAVITVDSYPFGYHFEGSGLGGWWAACFPKLTVDGQIAYCIDSGLSQGGNGQSNGVIGNSYTADNQISIALAYGYTSKTKYGYSADTERLATQIVIWNMLDGWYDNDKEATALNYFTKEIGDGTLISNVKTVYYKIKENITKYKILPSFNSNTAINKLTYNSNTKKWSVTLNDTKGVADQFDWASAIKGKSYLSVEAKSNSVTFTSTKAFDTITLNANYSNQYFTAIKGVPVTPVPGASCEQPVVTYRSADPPTATVKLYAAPATGNLELIKTSEDGKVAGIGFKIISTGGTYIGTYYTDSNGKFKVEDLKEGTYIVSEIPREGYVKQEDKRVTLEAGKTATVSFYNSLSRGQAKIIKTSDDGNVSNITFTVSKEDGTKIGDYITDSKGEILIPNLLPGVYIVTETVPNEYQPQEPKKVTVKADETAEVKFVNILIPGELKIYKRAYQGSISNITFTVSKEDGTKIGNYVTDKNGEIIIPNLKPGNYIVEEIVPKGYKAQKPQKVTVEKNKTTYVYFRNVPEDAGKLEIIKTSDDRNVYKVAFTIKTEAGKVIGTFMTDRFGKINVDLSPGVYIVIEEEDSRYEPQEPQRVTLETGKTATVHFNNISKGGIQLTKVDENDTDRLLSGAEFEVYFREESSIRQTYVGLMKEVSDGVYYLDNLKAGIYTVSEKKAPDGYELDTGKYTVTVKNTKTTYIVTNGDNNLFTNKPKPQIATLAASQSGGNAFAAGRITIEDTISYQNLIVGKTYTVKGSLMQPSFEWNNRETGVPFTVDGKQITAEKTFTPTASNGSVTLSFTFDTKEITQNTKIVVFEELYTQGKDQPIASHKDINDRNQTVEIHKPKITTSATSYNRKDVMAVGMVTIDDAVEYSDLIVGERYNVKGSLIDKTTGKAFTVNGNAVESGATFIATATSGTVAVRFTFNAAGITENTQVVAYERLYYNNIEIAAHTDINDKSQTVEILKPKISTTATSMNEKHAFGIGTVTIDDAVEYSNLIEDQEYVLVGVLMDKTTGKPFKVNGKTVEARTNFTPKAQSGTTAVRFAFDGSAVTENTKLVVFETLYRNGTEITSHKDINDLGQTVEIHKPEIKTTATSNGEKEVIAVGTITIDDVVSYKDLIVGKEYTVNGVLMNKTTGKAFTVNGKEVTAQAKFTPKTASGTVTVSFTFNANGITANTKLVAYERLYLKGVEIAVHTDINDNAQTVEVHKPSIGTVATSNGEKETIAVGDITVIDTVDYHDLIIGKEYTVIGILMDKTTGKPFTVNGEEVTAQTVFTTEKTDENVSVKFIFDSSAITENTKLVAFQTLYLNGVEIANHKDINDEGQTVEIHKPEIGTSASSEGEKEAFAVGTVTIDDIVKYHDLIIGKKYTVNGVLMNKATNQPFLVDDEEVTAQTTFTAESTDGEVTVTFTFDASGITENMTVVAFETMSLDGVEFAVHADINDEEQTVELKKPKINTVATINGEKDAFAVGETVIKDIISYENLIIGKEYTISGILMNKLTGEPLLINEEQVTAQTIFTADSENGEIETSFTFEGKEIAENTTLVVYETLSCEETLLTTHTDINDKNQTVEVHKPQIGTTAASNGEKEVIAGGEISINDVVAYHNLIVGKEYVVKGILMDKLTEQPFLVNGKEVTAETAFTAKAAEETVIVTFTFDSSAITENTKLVAFEALYFDGAVITSHNDINDEGQTVEIHKPEIGTSAAAKGEKETIAVGVITIEDVVRYHDLIVGKEYTVKGILMNKATNEALLVDGKEVTAQTTFIAETTDGEVTVTFTFDASGITESTTVVAFEKMYKDGIEIAVHTDIEDEEQTVELKKPEVGTKASINYEETAKQKQIVVEDIIYYKNLIAGKEYTVRGVLMDKLTGKPFLVNGKQITAETTFVAEGADGEVTVVFSIDDKAITKETNVVVFETVYSGDEKIASHTDITDKEQTITLIPVDEDVPRGDNPPTGVGIGICGFGLAAAAVVLFGKRRKK